MSNKKNKSKVYYAGCFEIMDPTLTRVGIKKCSGKYRYMSICKYCFENMYPEIPNIVNKKP